MSSIESFTNSSKISYGFIGLGIMGWEMAKNLRAKIPTDATLYICEINQQRREEFIADTKGDIQALGTPADIMKHSDVIFTMLPRGEHVRKVFIDTQTGLLSTPVSSEKPKVFIECSTIDVKSCEEVSQAVTKANAGVYADAPVSGGQGGAAAGTLTIMVGADESVFNMIKPVLEHMGNNLFHCGKIGAGLATKQINNYMSAVNTIAVCEGMNLGRLYGLNPATLAGVINTSTGMSRNSREQNPVKGLSDTASSAKDFKGGFSTELCHGVVMMSQELSDQLGAKNVLGKVVGDFYTDAVNNELCKGLDYRSIYKLFDNGERE